MMELLEEFDPEVPLELCCVRRAERWVSTEVLLDPERSGTYSALTLFFDLEKAERS